eukprot:40315-Prymnesium_polylepis.1
MRVVALGAMKNVRNNIIGKARRSPPTTAVLACRAVRLLFSRQRSSSHAMNPMTKMSTRTKGQKEPIKSRVE